MQNFRVKQSKLSGEIFISPSKSQTLRAILFGSLAKGKSVIYSYLPSPDAQAMIQACKIFGAKINRVSDRIEVEGMNGIIQPKSQAIDAGNSGIVLRFCSAIAALSSYPVVITGDESIRNQRPMQPLLEALNQLGVSASSEKKNGYAPIYIKGPLQGGKARLIGEDSQFVSALLIASSFGKGNYDIEVVRPGEKPWVALTLHWLDRLGLQYNNDHFRYYHVKGGQRIEGFSYAVSGDFSSAAFPLVAALVTDSEVAIHNLDMSEPQGDKMVIDIVRQMGAVIEEDHENQLLVVKKGRKLKGLKIDINSCIDAITILAVLACFAEGQTVIYNGAVAKQKECNRIKCITAELSKMGANIKEMEDGLIVESSDLKGAHVNSYGDHRMAMSLAVAAMGCKEESFIHNVQCVSKSYPSFLTDFQKLGASISL